MISKVSSTPNKAMGDLELKQGDAQKSKTKRGAPPPAGEKDSASSNSDDDSGSTGPIHIRFLGRNLDIIA